MTNRMVDIKLDLENINIKQCELNQSDSPSSNTDTRSCLQYKWRTKIRVRNQYLTTSFSFSFSYHEDGTRDFFKIWYILTQLCGFTWQKTKPQFLTDSKTLRLSQAGKAFRWKIVNLNSLKYGDTLSPLLSFFALEYAIRRVEAKQEGLNWKVHLNVWSILIVLIYWAEK